MYGLNRKHINVTACTYSYYLLSYVELRLILKAKIKNKLHDIVSILY